MLTELCPAGLYPVMVYAPRSGDPTTPATGDIAHVVVLKDKLEGKAGVIVQLLKAEPVLVTFIVGELAVANQ
jgi:hypothetical protein